MLKTETLKSWNEEEEASILLLLYSLDSSDSWCSTLIFVPSLLSWSAAV